VTMTSRKPIIAPREKGASREDEWSWSRRIKAGPRRAGRA
jgi:hypothetical protein